MAQKKKKQTKTYKKNELPMSKWDFERIASIIKTKNRKLAINKNTKCYTYNCQMAELLVRNWVGFQKDPIFKDEPNKPSLEDFLKSSGCSKYMEHQEAKRQAQINDEKEPKFRW
jgi:hypothetical protein